MTDNLGQSQVIPYLKGLSKDYNITILSTEKGNNLHQRKNIIQELLDDYSITWEYTTYTKFPPVLSTLWDIIKLSRKLKRILKYNDVKIIHARSYISALVAFKYRKESKIIFDMRGFWIDERVDGGLWNLRNPLMGVIFKYFKRKERYFLENADHTIALTEQAENIMVSWVESGYLKTKPTIQVIPCCADEFHFNPSREIKKDLRKELGISNDTFILLYLGSVGTWYMLEEMLLFFKSLRRIHGNSKFLLVSPDKKLIHTEVSRLKINESDIIVTESARKDVPHYIEMSNASIFFIKPAFSKKASSPTKMAEVLLMGKPVICNAGIGDVDMDIKGLPGCISVNDFSEPAFSECVSKIEIGPPEMNNNIRQSALLKYSLTSGIKKYSDVYQKLLES